MARSLSFNTAYPEELLGRLREAAAAEGVTVGFIVRRAVRWELERLRHTHADRRADSKPRAQASDAA